MQPGATRRAGHAALGWAGVAIAIGCTSPAQPRVEVAGAPHLGAVEGETTAFDIAVVPASAASPSLVVEVDSALRPYFDELEIREGAGGQPMLVVTPRCDLIPPGGGSALVPLAVRTVPDGLAAPAELTLLVEEQRGPRCHPRTRIWRDDSGGCDDQSAADQATFDFPPGEPGALCVQIRSLDPSAEPLRAAIRTNARPGMLSIPVHGGELTEATFAIGVPGSDVVRAAFELRVDVFPAAAIADPIVSRVAVLRFGAPGDVAIEVLGADQMLAAEFDVTSVGLRLWHLAEPGSALPCVRASRDDPPADPVPRTKPFLRLYAAGVAQPATDGEMLRATGPFTLSMSPPIDARAVERVTIEAGPCDDAAGLVFTEPPFARQVVLDVASVAEELTCPPEVVGPVVSDTPTIACIDLAGDPTPEIFVRRSAGNGCLLSGAENRHNGLTWAPGNPQVPVSVAAFTWNDGGDARPVLLGEFATGTRRLTITDPLAPMAAWTSADDLSIGGVHIPLGLGQPLAMDRTSGATHIVYPHQSDPASDWDLSIKCISPACVGGPPLALLPAVTTSQHRVVGIVAADLDADGTEDVLVASLPATVQGESRPLQLVAIRLLWQDAATVAEAPVGRLEVAAITVRGTGFQGVAVPHGGGHDVYAAVGDGAFDASVLRLRSSPAFFDPASSDPVDIGYEPFVATPGAAHGVAAADGKLHVSTSLGIWRRDGATWAQADPVLIEDALVGSATDLDPNYGRQLTSCVGASALAVGSTVRDIRFTATNVTVANP